MNNPSAFPDTHSTEYVSASTCRIETTGGMTIRDYFAAHVQLTPQELGFIEGRMKDGDGFIQEATIRYRKADAMLAEREKGTK